jgi:D-amino peptidase
MLRCCCWFILMFCSAAYGDQPSHLKVYISADMEGISGVSSEKNQSSPASADYEKFRRLMTQEVNAAISGAYDAGATEVVVSDSHWEGNNIDMELLDPRVRIVRGFPRPLGMMQGIDKTFDAVVFVGYHASEQQYNAILAHMEDGDKISAVKLNGVAVPEAGFNAAIAGDLGVPVVFLSGDKAACEEVTHLLGLIETVIVKSGSGFYSGTMLHPEKVQRMIREGVKRGIERRLNLKPYRVVHPVKLEITFKETFYAEIVSYFRNVERPTANSIVYTATDMTDASRFFSAIGYLHDE